MKVLHVNTSDIEGGAARGTYWLHTGLQRIGVESLMLVDNKSSDDHSVFGPKKNLNTQLANRIKDKIDLLPLQFYPSRKPGRFSPAWIPSYPHHKIARLNPDVINLHWICRGLVKPENLVKFGKPIVWTLRDMWPFTGGCHNAVACTKYTESCGSCPHLGSTKETDLSRKLWLRKQKSWSNLDFTIVAISHWQAENAKRSSLFRHRRIEVIHNALDETIFKPIKKEVARYILNLPSRKKIILFGALNAVGDKNKGFEYLTKALRNLSHENFGTEAEIVIFGSSKPQTPPDLGLQATYLGRIYDNSTLALIYSAADVMVVPSLQEAFGKTAIEAMACGTPVVSFDTSGLKDIVEHKKCGYRATCYETDDLTRGIQWVLEDDSRWVSLSHRAREKVELEFTLKLQAKRYLALYEDIVSSFTAMQTS